MREKKLFQSLIAQTVYLFKTTRIYKHHFIWSTEKDYYKNNL